MKKTLIISSAVTLALGLTAFGVVDLKSSEKCNAHKEQTDRINSEKVAKAEVELPNYYYGFGPRFQGVLKSDVYNATSVADFLDDEYMENIISFNSVDVIVIEKEAQSDIRANGSKMNFSAKQLKLLRSFDYSSNFTIQMDVIHKNPETGNVEEGHYGPHLTIVPEKQAMNSKGLRALSAFMKENTEKDLPMVDSKSLRPTKIYFTITKEGQLTNVSVHNTSGYPSIDAKLMQSIHQLPGKWTPAENSKGEKIDQELVLTFGGSEGC